MSTSTAWLISGNECAGTPRPRPVRRSPTTRPVSSGSFLERWSLYSPLSRAERFSAAHDSYDFGGDRVLSGSFMMRLRFWASSSAVSPWRPAMARCWLTLKGRGAFDRAEKISLFEGLGCECLEQPLDFGLELGIALQCFRRFVVRRAASRSGNSCSTSTAWVAAERNLVETNSTCWTVARDERRGEVARDPTRVVERRTVRHAR